MNSIYAENLHHYADLQRIEDPVLASKSITLDVLRLDKFVPELSGNKYFKLKNNIIQAKLLGRKQLLSFGGAFSNHIHALALAGKSFGIKTIGLIRGEEHSSLNETLSEAKNAGMDLKYLSRTEYRLRNNAIYLAELQREYPDALIIPEGGSNRFGVEGCKEIVEHINHHIGDDFDVIVVPCGTAATLAGIVAATGNKKVCGIAVLKNADYLENEVRQFHAEIGFTSKEQNWTLFNDYHFGGYAKINSQLIDFIDKFESIHNIKLEPVYSGKMFYGLYDLLNGSIERLVPRHSNKPLRVVAVHTGGLQGLRGMKSKIDKIRIRANS